MAKTEKYLEGLTIHKVPYNIANTSDFKTNVMAKAADNELFIVTDTPTFSLKIGNVTYDGTSNVSAVAATQSANGLMSAADKKKLDGIATGATKITVDTALSSTSTNPVQNKVIKTELDKKLDKTGGTLTGNLTGKYITGTWLQTTASTDLGHAPGKVAVLDESGWVYYRTPAEIKSDIGADAVVTTSSNGLMSASDKSKLDGIAAGANKTTVDTSLSSTSTNPVQNKVVNSAINNLNTLVGDTAVSTQIQNAVANKVDKVSGKGLSTNDYTTAEKEQVAANTTARHTHSNKTVLDKITSEKMAEWDSSIIVTFHGRWNDTDNSIVFSSTSTPYDDIQALLAAGKTPELSIQNDYGDWEAKFYLSRDGDGQYQFFSYERKMDGTPLLSSISVLADNSAIWRGIDLDNKLDCSGGTMTGQLTLNSTLILRSATYGDTLPSSGVAGQVFFKKV